MRGEAAFGGNSIVAESWMSFHHTNSLVVTNLAEPCAEVGVLRLVEVLGQYTPLDSQVCRKRKEISFAILESSFFAPLAEGFFYILPSVSCQIILDYWGFLIF